LHDHEYLREIKTKAHQISTTISIALLSKTIKVIYQKLSKLYVFLPHHVLRHFRACAKMSFSKNYSSFFQNFYQPKQQQQ